MPVRETWGRRHFSESVAIVTPVEPDDILRHHLAKSSKQMRRIVRTRSSFWMILNACGRRKPVSEALDGVIVEIAMRHHKFWWQ